MALRLVGFRVWGLKLRVYAIWGIWGVGFKVEGRA